MENVELSKFDSQFSNIKPLPKGRFMPKFINEAEKDSNMASSKDYLEFVLGQLSSLDGITSRLMMGEYIIYYRRKIAAYICDDRLLVKPVKAAVKYMPEAHYEHPYEGAKPMLLVDEVDNREYLTGLFNAIYDELPMPKQKEKNNV